MRAPIKAALIGAITAAAIGAASIAWDAYNNKPIIDYSFASDSAFFNPNDPRSQSSGFTNPKDHVQLEFIMKNRGETDGKDVMVTIAAEGAQVAFTEAGQYAAEATAPFYVQAENQPLTYKYYLKPTGSPETITLTISVADSLFYQVSPPSLSKLVYDKYEAVYQLRR